MNCQAPHTLTQFSAGGGVKIESNAVLAYLAPQAATDLHTVGERTGNVEVTSAFRTVVQQYLLYRWWEEGRCGITAAATPGTSNHESARAVDLANWSAVEGSMEAHGWSHDVPGDPVHFDHLSSPNILGRDVRAFQTLWNRNHPHDKIAEDGEYGPSTADRIARSPAAGFTISGCK